MGCLAGIWVSGLIRNRVVIDSCQIRRFVCIEAADVSSLDVIAQRLHTVKSARDEPRREYVNTWK